MNTFLNVVFRKILFRIPLKFLLLIFCVGAILFSSCNATDYFGTYQTIGDYFVGDLEEDISIFSSSYNNIFNYGNDGAGTYCLKFTSSNPQQLTMGFANGGSTVPNNLYTLYDDQYNNWICLYGNKPYLNVKPIVNTIINVEYFKLDQKLQKSVNNLEVGDYYFYGYDTVSISYTNSTISDIYDDGDYMSFTINPQIDSYYCENNNLCPVYTGECEESTGVNWSSLYINNIQHLGGPNIYISIPEEIGWDYFYYNDNFNLSISGAVYDYEKLDQVKSVQSYIPTIDDFSHIIGGFGPFGALLVGVLFVIFIFYLIKKIF